MRNAPFVQNNAASFNFEPALKGMRRELTQLEGIGNIRCAGRLPFAIEVLAPT